MSGNERAKLSGDRPPIPARFLLLVALFHIQPDDSSLLLVSPAL
ncbi:hypothetical protein [Laspinema sp. D2d]|nr:hypothetical protein [Laspinema sp. D2d]